MNLRSVKTALRTWLGGRRAYRFVISDWRRLTDLETSAQVVNALRFTNNLRPLETPPPARRTILVVAPHPDDEMLGPGGTLLAAHAAGCRIHVLYLTSGSDDERPARESEAQAACAHLGAKTMFLRWPDGNIALTADNVARFASHVESLAPDILMLPFLLDDHDDHRRANDLLLRAASRLGVRPEVWAYQVYSAVIPNVVVDITLWRGKKAALIRLHASQLRHRDWANFSLGLNAWTSRFLRSRSAAWAEAFFVLPMNEYLAVCRPYFEKGAYYADSYLTQDAAH